MGKIEPQRDDTPGDGSPVSPPRPRTALFWDGYKWHVPRVDDEGRVQVRGEDQLFSYREALCGISDGAISGADGYRNSGSPSVGYIWKVTNVDVVDVTSPTTVHAYNVNRAGTNYRFGEIAQAFGVGDRSKYHGEVWLDSGDVVRVYFSGGLEGDRIILTLTGFVMSVE